MGREFKLDDKQQKRIDAWLKHHFDVVHGPKWYPKDFTGACVRFSFMPTSMGDNVKCECIWCPKDDPAREVDLTVDYDTGDFIYEYDENWKRLRASWE